MLKSRTATDDGLYPNRRLDDATKLPYGLTLVKRKPNSMWCSASSSLILLSVLAAPTARADAEPDFTQLGLEDLMAVQVTGVTRRAEPLGRTPAAVFVLSAEDIRRSGARNIAEALRLVPGLDVARINASSYAISARGFNAGSADKLQVLLDGRSVYTPLTSSVFWDVLDTYLPDLARIEVIRGPAGAVWGANAVNGVINIVTKSAADTQGTQVLLAAGTEQKHEVAVRTGGRFGKDGKVRLYAKSAELDGSRRPSGGGGPDGKQLQQGGFRMDWGTEPKGSFTVSGDAYDGENQDNNGSTDVDGGNLLANWKRQWQSGAESSAQLNFDTYNRRIPGIYIEERRNYALDLQHSLPAISGHQLTFGITTHISADKTGGPPVVIIFDPQDKTLSTYGGFAQDQLGFGDGKGTVVLGARLEHNDYTGFELQPSLRAGWQFNPAWYGWSSVSRAVRTPNRINRDIAFFCSPRFATALNCTAGTTLPLGTKDFDSEKLIAYESGLRWRASSQWVVELAGFYNDYSKLTSFEGVGVAGRYGNRFDGRGLGGELNASWNPVENFQLTAFYSYLDLDLKRQAGSIDRNTEATVEGNSPANQAGLRANWQPSSMLNLSSQLRYVDALPAQQVPGYAELDLRAGWWLRPDIELALVGQNLLQRSHAEFGLPANRLEIERSLLAELRWSWQ